MKVNTEQKKTDKVAASAPAPRGEKYLYSELSFGAREAFKRLRTNVMCSFDDERSRVIGITSSQPSEGKSLVSFNFASSLAELGKKVIIVDSDIYRPSLHKKLADRLEDGLTDLVIGSCDIERTIRHYTSDDGKLKLDYIVGGTMCDNPSELLNSKRISMLMSSLKRVYDYVVVDMPPIGSISDVAAVSRSTDGMLIVIREQYCPKKLLQICVEQLQYAGAKILGFVLNGSLEGTSRGYSYKGRSGYGYNYNYGYHNHYYSDNG